MPTTLTPKLAERFATLTLANVTREYPNILVHVLTGPEDLRSPRELHPIFFGCFDWHSCVHGYWQLARLLRLFPDLPLADAIRRQLDAAFTTENVQAEMEYFLRPASRGFERPYGWAWLLALATELGGCAIGGLPGSVAPARDAALATEDTGGQAASGAAPNDPERWHATLAPLAGVIAGRFVEYLPRATYPTRCGTHGNSAFAITLAYAYATSHRAEVLRSLLERTALTWYANDADCQAWEPSQDDFLSPALMQAACIEAVLPRPAFTPWLSRFLPAPRRPPTPALFTPATPTDRTDGKIAHLDGLNLSRAWCMRRIAAALPADDRRVTVLREAAAEHVAVSLPHVAYDYAGAHWLATFAVLAMSAG